MGWGGGVAMENELLFWSYIPHARLRGGQIGRMKHSCPLIVDQYTRIQECNKHGNGRNESTIY